MKSIEFSSRYITSLIQDMSDWTLMKNQRFKKNIDKFHVKMALEEIVDNMKLKAEAKNIYCVLKVEDEVPSHINTDVERLGQVIVILMDNAIKHTFEGGVVVMVDVSK